MKSPAETRSGSRVKVLWDRDSSRMGPRPSWVVKEGKTEKLARERDNITRWQALMPGLTPQLHSFHAAGDEGTLVLEHLPGDTFESMLLHRPWEDVLRALTAIQHKLVDVWTRSHSSRPVAPRFLRQLSSRLVDVAAAHPELWADSSGGHEDDASFAGLLERLLPYDDVVEAPFSVFIHGDFNIDNVIYDVASGEVRFIDVHRSAMMDYVQDISVFLVSQLRLQLSTGPARRRAHAAMSRFFAFANEHAAHAGDASFHQRLALGLARSFATSTRFVLDRELARSMFSRSRYILERLAEPLSAGRGSGVELTREVLLG